MKLAAIRSHRLYKHVMLGSALFLFISAFVVYYYLSKDLEKTTIDEPSIVVVSGVSKSSKVVFRKAAALQLKKDPNELTEKDFTEMTALSVGQSLKTIVLYDLNPLKKFVNLQELDLSNLIIPKMKPNWMSYLVKTGIYKPRKKTVKLVYDLSPLKKLSKLRKLKIYKTSISDIKPLASLSKLESLDLSNTQISDIKPLAALTTLESLDLASTNIYDSKLLAGFTNLESLNLSRTQIFDMQPLAGLTKLKSLDLASTKIYDFKLLAGFTNLESLNLNSTQISDLKPLKGLKNLQTLNITRCGNITDEQVKELQKALPNLVIQGETQDISTGFFN